MEEFAKQKDDLARNAAAGNVQFAFDVFNARSLRIAEYRDFARDFLSKPIQYDPEETFRLDREDAPWPKTAAEQHDIWAKRLKNELIVARMSDRAAEEDAKEAAEAKKDDESGDKDEAMQSWERRVRTRLV